MASLTNLVKNNKLALSFLLIIVLFFSCGLFTILGLVTLGNLMRTIYEHPLVVSNASLSAALNIAKMHRSMKDVVLANADDEINGALRAVAENERVVFQQLDIIRENILGEEGRALERQTRQLFVNWKPIRDEVVRLMKSGRRNEAVRITKAKGADHVSKLESEMLLLSSYARNKATNFLESAERSRSRLANITVALTLAGVFISIIIAFIASYLVLKSERVLQFEKRKLQEALDEIKTLRGILPICSHCKKIRDDAGLWQRMEQYIHDHSDASFSHGICPDCLKEYYPEMAAKILEDKTE